MDSECIIQDVLVILKDIIINKTWKLEILKNIPFQNGRLEANETQGLNRVNKERIFLVVEMSIILQNKRLVIQDRGDDISQF